MVFDPVYLEQELFKWMNDFVEQPNPLLGNWAPCPYARAARINKRIHIMFNESAQEFDRCVEQAKEILRKANDPTLKEKLLDIFQKGKQNPYLQSGIITITGSLVAGGILSYGQRLGLNAGQTNILLQSVMNSVIPTLVSVLNGKNWTDTVKYVLTSAGLGTGIAAIAEEDNDYSLKEDISHEEVDLIMSNLIEKIITNEAIQNNKQ